MFFLHPKLKFTKFLKLSLSSFNETDLKNELNKYFPNKNIVFTDSGRSALAVIIESLSLQDTEVALPAYICDVLSPILKKYNITPVFLDVDPQTFQPPLSEYKKLNKDVSAILVCHTYGIPVSTTIFSYLKKHNKTIIEDCAHCLNFSEISTKSQQERSTAQYFSLPKIIPAPDGGLAVINGVNKAKLGKNNHNLGLIKKMAQLFALIDWLMQKTKQFTKIRNLANPVFDQPRKPTYFSLKMLFDYLISGQKNTRVGKFYCKPILAEDPLKIKKILYKHNIFAQRIWSDPIIAKNSVNFPNTQQISKKIICLPMCGYGNINNYQKILQNLLPQNFANKRQNK